MANISVIGTGNMGSAIAGIAAKGGASVQIVARDAAKAQQLAAQVGLGGLSQRATLRSIELLATEVLPEVRRAVAAG